MILEPTEYGVLRAIATGHSLSATVVANSRSVGTASADLTYGVCLVDTWCWWLARVVVTKPQLRGQGLGTLLVRRLQALVSASRTQLLAVAPGGYGADPERQQSFYRRLGFELADDDGLLIWRGAT